MTSLLDDFPGWFEDVEGEPYDEPMTLPPGGAQIKVSEVYDCIMSKLRGILDYQVLLPDHDRSLLDDMLLQLQFWERSIANDTNSLGDFERQYQPEADALLKHLQIILSNVIHFQELLEDKSEVSFRPDEYGKLTEALKMAFEDLSDATESVQILITINTGRGSSARIKKAFAENELIAQTPQRSLHSETSGELSTDHRKKRPRDPNSRNLDPVVLGLDLGATATRACLACLDHDINKRPEIVLRPKEHNNRERFDAGDFPSAANFFSVNESPQLCIGYIGDNPDQIPVKMYPYIARITVMRKRGSIADGEFEKWHRFKIPQLDHFFHRFDRMDTNMQARVMSHARKVFLAHLSHIQSHSEMLAASRGWEIKKVAATIPPNWERWTQHLYILLLKLTWKKFDTEAITLLHESEAIGHWLLCLDKQTRREKPKRLILADFGGHTLNHSVFEINYHNNDIDQFFFFTLSFDNCFHGGSELHASFVTEKIQKEIVQGNIEVNQNNKQYAYVSLMDNYRLEHRSNINGCSFSIRGWASREYGERSKPVEISFNNSEASKLYDKCFAKPLAELYSVFRKNASFAEDAVVVLNGGTFSNEHVLRQTKKEIRKAGLRYLPWTEVVQVDGRKSSTVAAGAALALVRAISVKEFMRQAAFAVMVKNTTQKEIPVIWNSFGPQKTRITLSSQQGADVSIACCPLPPHDGSLTVPLENTFELQSLGNKVKGSYTVSLDYAERDIRQNLPDRLILTVTRDAGGKRADADRVIWPVYYDPGACVIFVDNDVDNDECDKIPSSEDDGPRLAPKRFTNKKRKRSDLRLERNQADPGSVFREGTGYPSPPLETLRQFEMDQPTQNDNTSPIEKMDVDPVV